MRSGDPVLQAVGAVGGRRDLERFLHEELLYRGHSISLDVTKEQMAQAGNCLTFSDATAKRIRSDNNNIKYVVDIKPALND